MAVRGGDSGHYNVLVIGAGAAGLGAAQEALRQGLTVKILEARNRLGGRIETVDMGPYKVDMGASWIHGIGPGCGDSEEWQDKENPIYTIAKENGIETVSTWNDEGDANTKYYWYNQQNEPFDDDKIDKLTERLEGHLEKVKEDVDQNLDFQKAFADFEVEGPEEKMLLNFIINEQWG